MAKIKCHSYIRHKFSMTFAGVDLTHGSQAHQLRLTHFLKPSSRDFGSFYSGLVTLNPEYFIHTQFSNPGLSDLSYA